MMKYILIILFALFTQLGFSQNTQRTIKVSGGSGSGGSGGGGGLNIYNSDSSLSGNRTVDMADRNLIFSNSNGFSLYLTPFTGGDRGLFFNNGNGVRLNAGDDANGIYLTSGGGSSIGIHKGDGTISYTGISHNFSGEVTVVASGIGISSNADRIGTQTYGDTGLIAAGQVLGALVSSNGTGLSVQTGNGLGVEVIGRFGLSAIDAAIKFQRINSTVDGEGPGHGMSIEMGLGSSPQYLQPVPITTNRLITTWTDTTAATRTAEFSITGLYNDVDSTLFTLFGSGQGKLNKYGLGRFVGTAIYNLGVTADGEIVEVNNRVSVTAQNGVMNYDDTTIGLGGTLFQTTIINPNHQAFSFQGTGNTMFIIDDNTPARQVEIAVDSHFFQITPDYSAITSSNWDFAFSATTGIASFYDSLVMKSANVKIRTLSGHGTGILTIDNNGRLDYGATPQATLVSGTNIKTVNGSSLLGSGNLAIGASTLQQVFDTQSGGADITKKDTILLHGFGLYLSGLASGDTAVNIRNAANGVALGATVNTSGSAFVATTANSLSVPVIFVNNQTVSSVTTILQINKQTGASTPTNGLGNAIEFRTATSTSGTTMSTASKIISRTTNVTAGAVVSELQFGVMNSSVFDTSVTIQGGQPIKLNKYTGTTNQTTDTTLNKPLTKDSLGNIRALPYWPNPTLTASQVAYGSAGNSLTSSADVTWSQVDQVFNVGLPSSGASISVGGTNTYIFEGYVQVSDGLSGTVTINSDVGGTIFTGGPIAAGYPTGPPPSAILSAFSTTQGFLPPVMTATQASAIASPAQGLMLFVTNTNGTFTSIGWWGWTGSAWNKLNN